MNIEVRVTTAKDGNGILEVVKNGQVYRLNSTYNPITEAEKFAKQYEDLEEDSVLLVFGFGNGIFADALMKACGNTTKVVFFEPCAKIVKCIMDWLDVASFCDNWNCEFVADLVGTERKEHLYIIQEFNKVLQKVVLYHKRNKVHFCILPKYKELFLEEYNQYWNKIEFYMQMLQANTQTARAIGHIAVENNINILKYIPNSYCVDSFVNIFPENMPAILVSAGPSLENNVKELQRAKDKALIVCVDSAVRYMLKENIFPDIIVTIDPRKELSLFDDQRIRDIPLVGVTDMSYKVLEKVQSKMLILASAKNPYIQKLYNEAGHQIGELESGGSVATTAYSLCRYLGFKRLILVGQDLALKDSQMYAGRQKLSMEDFQRELIEIEDVYGKNIYTTRDYYYYLKWFEQMTDLYPQMQLIDATEGGAKIKGTFIMTLQEAIDKYAKEEHDISKIIAGVKPVYNQERKCELIQRLIRDRDRYDELVKKLEYGIVLTRKGKKIVSSANGKNIEECLKINREIFNVCNMYEESDSNFLIQREIDATDLDNYLKLCERQQRGSNEEQYELMEQYFECILRAANSVKSIYDGLKFE